MNYIEFVNLGLDDRAFIEEQCLLAVDKFEVDCTLWKWGQVKEAQDCIATATYADILKMVGYESKLNHFSSAESVLLMFRAISKSIQSITEMEVNEMQYEQSAKEMAASVAVGGFDRFGTSPQTYRLTEILNDSYQNILNYPYIDCINALIFKSVESDFQRKVVTK